MANVGFTGGSLLCEEGPASDMVVFFNCLRLCAAEAGPSSGELALVDRLYRRYLKLDELDAALAFMTKAQGRLAQASALKFDWTEAGLDPANTQLNLSGATLAVVFDKYFQDFPRCVEAAKSFSARWNILQPVRVVKSQVTEFTDEKKRPLDEYEQLQGDPFWLG